MKPINIIKKLNEGDISSLENKPEIKTVDDYIAAHKDMLASYDENVSSVAEYFMDNITIDEIKQLSDDELLSRIGQTMSDMWDGDDDIIRSYIQNKREPYGKIYTHDVNTKDVLTKVKEYIKEEGLYETNKDN